MDALLERLAAVYCLAGMVAALLPSARYRALAGAGSCFLGLSAAAATIPATPGSEFARLNLLLAASGMVVTLAGVMLGLRRLGTPPPELAPAELPASAPLDPLLLAGLGLAALAGHLLLFGLGALLAVTAAARAALRARRPPWLIPLALAVAALGTALWLTLTVLGPGSARLEQLGEGPFSPAAERLLVLLLGGSALLLAGVPPVHRAPWGRALAPLAALLIARLVAPAFPLGLATWQPLAMLLLVGGLAAAAWSGRWAQAAVAGGLLTLWSGSGAGVIAGGVLVAWGWLVETGRALASRRGITLGSRWAGLPAIPAVLAALPALSAALRAQVLLSVIAVAACAAGLVAEWQRGARASRAPLY